jgi:hypothetical protein
MPNNPVERMSGRTAPVSIGWSVGPLIAHLYRCAYMTRSLLIAYVVLLASEIAAFGQAYIDQNLVAAARKALAAEVSTNDVAKALEKGLWNSNRTAIAISINRVPKPSLIFVFLRQSNGHYLAGNVSGVEGGNFWVLGTSGRAGYERFETTPVEWLHRDDGRFQVVMRTGAWKSGRRYTVSERLVIDPDGTPLYR